MFRLLHTFNTFTLQDTISLWGQTDHRSVNESGSAKPVLCPCQAAGRVDDLEPTDNNDNKHAVIFTPVPPALQLDLQRKHSAARLDLMSSCWCLSVISNSPLALRTALHKAIKRRSMTHSVVCAFCYSALTVIAPILITKQIKSPFISPRLPAELIWQANELNYTHPLSHTHSRNWTKVDRGGGACMADHFWLVECIGSFSFYIQLI